VHLDRLRRHEERLRDLTVRVALGRHLRDRVLIVIFAYETGVNEPAPAVGRSPGE
jgi:hypothetical protein